MLTSLKLLFLVAIVQGALAKTNIYVSAFKGIDGRLKQDLQKALFIEATKNSEFNFVFIDRPNLSDGKAITLNYKKSNGLYNLNFKLVDSNKDIKVFKKDQVKPISLVRISTKGFKLLFNSK